MFQLSTLLKPDFNCCNNVALSCVDKVTTGTYDSVSVISNFPSPVELVITQVDENVKIQLTSQLINDISRVLQNLLKYFNLTIILTPFSLQLSGVFPVIFILDLHDAESTKLSFGSSL